MNRRSIVQSFFGLSIGFLSVGLTHAFTFTNFSSSNLPGRVLGTNAQSLNGTRSGSIVAGAYMLATAEFTTVNPLNIANTTILIDGLTGTIVDLGSNSYKARVQMPGNNGVDRFLTISVPQRDDGVTTGTIASSTGIAGKTVYYIVNPSIYSSFASRCLSGDIQTTSPVSNGIYSGVINPIGSMRVYCHNVMMQFSMSGTSVTGAIVNFPVSTGIKSYIAPTLTALNLPTDLWSYYSQPGFFLALPSGGVGSFNTTLIPDGIYTYRLFILTNGGALASGTPRLLISNITIDNTPPVVTLTSTGAGTGSFTGLFTVNESASRSVALSAGTGCTGGAVVQTGNGSGLIDLNGLTAGSTYCASITTTDTAGHSTVLNEIFTTAVTPLAIISSTASAGTNNVTVDATANQIGDWTVTLSAGLLCEAPFVAQFTGTTATGISQGITGLTPSTQYCYSASISAGAQAAFSTGLVTTLAAVVPAPIPPSDGGGGGGRLLKDECPLGDFSPSYYDDTCGVVPLTGNTNTGGDVTNPFPTDGSTPGERLGSALDNFENIAAICTRNFPSYGNIYFNDVVGHPYENNINALLSYCAIQGVDPTAFLPDRNVTRAEAIKIVLETTKIVRGLEITKTTDPTTLATSRYSDLTSDYRANAYIHAAFELGILRDLEQPTADGRFTLDPNAPISRDDLVRMIQNAGQALNIPNTQVTFTPRDTVTRGELSDAIVRIFNIQRNQAFLATRQNNRTLLQAIVTRLETLTPPEQITYLTNVRNLINSASSTFLRQLRLDKLSLIELIDAVLR